MQLHSLYFGHATGKIRLSYYMIESLTRENVCKIFTSDH